MCIYFQKEGSLNMNLTMDKYGNTTTCMRPFDFAIQKTKAEIEQEKKQVLTNSKIYFLSNSTIEDEVLRRFDNRMLALAIRDSISNSVLSFYKNKGEKIIQNVYANGFLEVTSEGVVT